jgi:hypothetical protein
VPPSKHQPDPEAPEAEWQEYLRGNGYVPETEPRPVGNYRAFHGYWVPPRMGLTKEQVAAAAPAPRAPRKRRVASDAIDPAWYTNAKLILLYRNHPDVFRKLRERLNDVEEMVSQEGHAERLEEQRTVLGLGVEAGLMNQEEADRRLAAWAAEHGVTMPTEG